MKFIDLCAGVGGISLGLERSGHECVGQIEIDDYCRRVLDKHWPHVPKMADVKEVDGTEFGEFDLLAGGYPCQPFSYAGKRGGDSDERHLWPEFKRIIRNVRPRYVLLENVPGHLTLGFGRVLGDLAEIGYDAEWDCIPASAVGAPHRRDRVFILAYPQSESGNGSNDHTGKRVESRQESKLGDGSGKANVAYPDCEGLEGWSFHREGASERLARTRSESHAGQWSVEPNVGRVANGISHRVERLKSLGNAVVPAVAQYIGSQLET